MGFSQLFGIESPFQFATNVAAGYADLEPAEELNDYEWCDVWETIERMFKHPLSKYIASKQIRYAKQ